MSSNYFIGEYIYRFYNGEKFVFIYEGNGEFSVKTEHGKIIPSIFREEFLND